MSDATTKHTASPADFDRGERHTIFVEGELDAVVIKSLITDVGIVQMGGSRTIRNYATTKIVYENNPLHYFMVDRDHHDDSDVSRHRNNFQKSNKPNLLMWKLREIENNFFNPNILEKSSYFVDTKRKELRTEMENIVCRNLLLDVTNHEIGKILSTTRVDFTDFTIDDQEQITLENISRLLHKKDELKKHIEYLKNDISIDVMVEKIRSSYGILVEEKNSIGHFSESIMKIIKGKEALNQIINFSPPFFSVTDKTGKHLQGVDRLHRIVEDLINNPECIPDDLKIIRSLIQSKIGSKF